jgi:hypothetical protein
VTFLLLALFLLLVLAVLLPCVVHAAGSLSHGRRRAERRAQQMLADVLAPAELQELQRQGFLRVRSPQWQNRVYYIPRHQGMVAVYQDGALLERLCVSSATYVPEGDLVVLHKLMIEANEDEYLRVANHFPPRPYSFQI